MEGKGIGRQSAVDLMAGAIGSLLPKLGEFLKQEHDLQTSIKQDIESLETQLRTIMDAALPRVPQDDKHCAYELRELSNDIEDIMDNLLLLVDKASASKPIANHDSFREILENIKTQVKSLSASRVGNFVATISTVDPCLDDMYYKGSRRLVGIHKLRDTLISSMSSSSQRLKKISIWGAGGMGKTTLAKAVYENMKGDFHCSTFVSIGQLPDMKKTLRDILTDIGKERYMVLNMTKLDKRQLIEELRHFLRNKRFLIVIDDIWDMPSCEVIKCALVDSGCGSRVITTSHRLDVAETSGEVFELMPLSIDGSKELFYATLFGSKRTITFDPLDEQFTEYILHKCGGVPLAIITIASLLARKPQEEWTRVYNSIGFGDEDYLAVENTRRIIQCSYYDLPSHLKTCILYLSIFPQDYVIEKDALVWRWVAEGFVHEEQGESLFKIGEKYFYELISRSMIELVENEGTNICACRVHDMVLDLIRPVGKQESFITILDRYDHDQSQSYQSNARIIAIQNRVLEKHDLTRMHKPKVRSLNGYGCRISSMTLLLLGFQNLRVLSLESCEITADGSDGLKNLVGLLHLRYLGLHGRNIWRLPREIGDLRYLQTLVLTDTYITELPHSVTLLRQLKCLRCFGLILSLPKGMGNLTSLEELRLGTLDSNSLNFAKELSKMKDLRVLSIINTDSFYDKWMESLAESLSKLHKMEELELFCDGPSSYEPCCSHVIAPVAFPKLRYLRTKTWLMFHPGAMPCLKSVELHIHVHALKDANFDFHNFSKLSYLRLLENAHVQINCWGAKMEAVEEAEVALKQVVHTHPNRPTLILERFGRCADDKEFKKISQNKIWVKDTYPKPCKVKCIGLLDLGYIDKLHHSRVAPEVMPLELLSMITEDFSKKRKLGSGTFGTVYKGVQNNGKAIAVKLLHSMPQRLEFEEEEFRKEFENLRRLNHPNIVELLGYCYETRREFVKYEGKFVLADEIYRVLCFEFMHNGSLQEHLDDEFHGLDWQTRYKIIKGTCEGLKYLHEGLESPMYHLDLKPGNILLDMDMAPKLADFGLSKLVYDDQTRATFHPLGTIGYCPPEFIEQNYVSNKFDIFSLGVVMIKIIAGCEGYRKTAEMPSQEFIYHVQENWRKRVQVIPGCTLQKHECHQMKRCIEIALDCIHPDRKQRPNIGDITSWLNETENNIENWPGSHGFSGDANFPDSSSVVPPSSSVVMPLEPHISLLQTPPPLIQRAVTSLLEGL